MHVFHHSLDEDTHLRSIAEADAEELFALVDANRAHLREWLPWVDANTEVTHTRQFIASAVKQNEDELGLTCVIVQGGRIVGIVGYHPINQANKSVEIGYWLSREVVGRGLMTRSCGALIDHAFGVLGLNRVAIPAAVGNARSRAIPERLGFTNEGITREAEWLYDRWVDHVRYSLLAREWVKRAEDGSLR
ncbi:MAG: GNAT family N-acetyltransferase [Actinobacteria bacterium]|nr:GNAT family N-acetyltransferase [Actinomycetota bacterium]